jgi:hypothetical protein
MLKNKKLPYEKMKVEVSPATNHTIIKTYRGYEGEAPRIPAIFTSW